MQAVLHPNLLIPDKTKNSFVKLININRLLWPTERPTPAVQTESPSRDTPKRSGQETQTNYLEKPVSAEGDARWYLYCWLNTAKVIWTSGEIMMMIMMIMMMTTPRPKRSQLKYL